MSYYTEQAEKIETRARGLFEDLANQRLSKLCRDWKYDAPPQLKALKIIFGNGTEHVDIDGKMVNSWDWPLVVIEAMADVHEICDGYTRACPNDIEVTR